MWWQEASKPIRDTAMLSLGPSVTILLVAHYVNTSDWRSSLILAVGSYGAFFVLYCLWQLKNSAIAFSKARSLELESLRNFKAQAIAQPIYIGPQNYCTRIGNKHAVIELVVVRRAPVRISHLKVTVSGKNGRAFSRDFTDPSLIKDSGQIRLDDIILLQEEVDRLSDTAVLSVGVRATLEDESSFEFGFSSIPLRG